MLCIAVITISCKKSSEPPPGPPPTGGPGGGHPGLNVPGFGKSTAPFSDPAWALPAGVTMNTNAHWFDFCNSDTNWIKKKNYIGVPNPMLEFFLVCLEFRNNTTQPINIPLPPIICLQSKYLETQNGFIMTNNNTLSIAAQNIRRIFCPVYCVNYKRRAPFDRVDLTNEWTLGPDQLPAPLQEIVDIVEPKNITFDKILRPDGVTVDTAKAKKLWAIQEAIWEVTDSTGLSNQTKQKLINLQL